MSNTAVKTPPLMTVAEFLEWSQDDRGTRYELVEGEIRAMAPGSDAHNTIVSNINFLIALHLRGKRPHCRVVSAPGVQPHVRADWNFRIPDLGVTCTPNRLGYIMTPDPILLIEVLSPSNSQDTWGNVAHYTTVPSVSEIAVFNSTRVRAEVLRRDAAGGWPPNPDAIEAGQIMRFASIEAECPIEDCYRGTHLAP